ncbi:MAG: polysaccharide pyruvyl transferase family protein [Erythrobacter sp.]
MSDQIGKVAIIHAFSRRNAGDGLLVDLTLELLSDAGVSARECMILALDPDSFAGNENVERAPGEPAARLSRKLAGAAIELGLSHLGLGKVERLLQDARAIVAVGGGYLVGDSPVRQAGIMLNHYAQLHAAARAKCPTVYLPQSIGPLDAPTAALVRSALQKLDRIWARDDETARELAWPNVRRCTDLAVMKLGKSFETLRPAISTGAPVIVGRDLPRPGRLVPGLKELGAKLGDAVWAVQAETEGSRSDREFYRRIGVPASGRLAEVLAQPTGPVVSIRLHGAIAALLAGRPTIHLAYERKGWGAFEDLGLGDYVHDARNFDPALVAAQVAALQHDTAGYWDAVRRASKGLAESWDLVVADLRQHLNAGRSGDNPFGVELQP